MPIDSLTDERKLELPPRAFVRQCEVPMDGLQQLTDKISPTLSIVASWQAAYDLGIIKSDCATSYELERLPELKRETDRIVREGGIK